MRMGLGIVGAVDRFDVFLDILQGMKDAEMVRGLGEDLGDDRAVVLAQVGDNDIGMIALGSESQEKGRGAGLVVMRIDRDVQQIIGPDVDGEVDVHPAAHGAVRLVVLGHQHIFLVHTDDTTASDQAEQGGNGQKTWPQAWTQRQAVRLATPRAAPVRR